MTAINPFILWDVGFQLSFAATAGLIWLTPPLERVAQRPLSALVGPGHVRVGMRLLSTALLVTLATQIATGPLIVYHFGRLSVISLLTNLLILPVQPLVMTAGELAAVAGMIWQPAGQALGWLAWLPLAWTVWVVNSTAAAPLASVTLGHFSPWLLAAIYAGLVAVVRWASPKTHLLQLKCSKSAPSLALPSSGHGLCWVRRHLYQFNSKLRSKDYNVPFFLSLCIISSNSLVVSNLSKPLPGLYLDA